MTSMYIPGKIGVFVRKTDVSKSDEGERLIGFDDLVGDYIICYVEFADDGYYTFFDSQCHEPCDDITHFAVII